MRDGPAATIMTIRAALPASRSGDGAAGEEERGGGGY
jgi:hypothetical protein